MHTMHSKTLNEREKDSLSHGRRSPSSHRTHHTCDINGLNFVCWKNLIIITEIFSRSGSRLRTHSCSTRNPFTKRSAQQIRPTVGRTQQPKLQKMSRHPPLYNVHFPQSAYTSDGIPQISVRDNYEKTPIQGSHHPTRRCQLLQCPVSLLVLR